MPQRNVLSLQLLVACLFISLLTCAQGAHAQLRVVTYNVAKLLGNDQAMHNVISQLMVDDKPGFSAPVSVFIFQEVRNSDIAKLSQLLNSAAPPGVLYQQGTYTNIGEDGPGGAQAMFYRAGMLLEDTAAHKDIFTGAGRYADRWRLRLLGYDSPDASFYIYSSHLKASQGSSNALQRLQGVQAIRADADTLPPGTHIIFGGDFNFYHNQESGYLYFLTPGNAQAIDPLGTDTWSGPSNAIKHSQSPRMVQAGGLVGGGMNNRFDFLLNTAALHDGAGLSIIPGSYRSLGNDGQHYDKAINDGNNFYYPSNIQLSNFIAKSLHDASDHVPVVVDYQIPARMSALVSPASLGRIIQGADVAVNFYVQNSAQYVNTPLGAEGLVFSAIGSGGIGGQAYGQAYATQDMVSGSLPVNTFHVGPLTGSVTFFSPNEAVQPQQIVRNVTATVVRPAAASFSADTLMQQLSIDISCEPDTGLHTIHIPVHNYQYDTLQALLNLNAVDGLTAPFAYVSGLAQNIGDEPVELVFSLDTNDLPDGHYQTHLVIHTSDEPLPGAAQSELHLTLSALVGDAAACTGDANNDGVVDISDMLAVLDAWGTCLTEECAADINNDGVIDISDLLAILNHWGACDH